MDLYKLAKNIEMIALIEVSMLSTAHEKSYLCMLW